MIRQAIKLFTLLNSETSAWQLAFGASFGMLLGFTPFLGLHTVFVVFFLLALRVNISFALLFWGVCSGLAYWFDSSFHQLGWSILNAPALNDWFTAAYNHPVWRWSQFNNTVMMGSFVAALLVFFPLALVMKWLVDRYRVHLRARLEKMRIVQALKASRWFNTFNQLGQ